MSLKRNVVWNLAGAGLPLLLGAAAIPYLVRSIGIEAFGILTLIWTLIGYFSLFDFGLGRALTQLLSVRIAAGRLRDIPHLVTSGLLLTFVAGVVGGLVLATVSWPLAYGWLRVSPLLQDQTALSLLIAAAGIPLTTTTTGLRGVLEAYEDFKAVNLIRMWLGAANFALPVLSVMLFGESLTYIVATLIAARIVALAAYWMRVNNMISSKSHTGRTRARDVKRLVSFGAWMTVSNIISPLMVSADRFLIAAMVGAGAVAYYTVPFEVLVRVLVIPGALTAALFPRLAATLKRNAESASVLYRHSTRLVSIALALICIPGVIGSYWVLSAWLGMDFASRSWLIASILSLGILLNGIAFVPYAVIQAAGDARTTAQVHIAQMLVYVPVLLLLLHSFGVVGAAIAWTLRAALDLSLLLFFSRKTMVCARLAGSP